jgi:CheY-like chemotaxis protein
MSVSILVVDDESDVAELFRQRFRREAREGTYVLHFALSAEEALDKLADGIRPQLIVILSDVNMPGTDGLTLLREINQEKAPRPTGHDGDRLWRRRAPPAGQQIRRRRIHYEAGRFRFSESTAAPITGATRAGGLAVTNFAKIRDGLLAFCLAHHGESTYFRFWHKPAARCGAKIWPLSGVQRPSL